MTSCPSALTITDNFPPVKSTNSTTGGNLRNPVRHHKYSPPPDKLIVSFKSITGTSPYGVSPSQRVLSPQLLLKRFDQVKDCLEGVLGSPPGEREATLRLLRFWAYYGKVYPKAATVCSEPGCSKATFWRAIAHLRELGLVRVIPRYVIRPHAQISSLYLLDRLILLLARYLAEHGTRFWQRWLEPYLRMPGRRFWSMVYQSPEARAGP